MSYDFEDWLQGERFDRNSRVHDFIDMVPVAEDHMRSAWADGHLVGLAEAEQAAKEQSLEDEKTITFGCVRDEIAFLRSLLGETSSSLIARVRERLGEQEKYLEKGEV